MRKGQKKITPEDFVFAWQTSESMREVKKKTRLSETAIRLRAHFYKRHGVPLKKHFHGNDDAGVNWESLIHFAEKLISPSRKIKLTNTKGIS